MLLDNCADCKKMYNKMIEVIEENKALKKELDVLRQKVFKNYSKSI